MCVALLLSCSRLTNVTTQQQQQQQQQQQKRRRSTAAHAVDCCSKHVDAIW